MSQKLRRSFRKEKADLIAKSRSDDCLRNRYSLPANLRLDEPDEALTTEETLQARTLMREGREKTMAKRRREEAELGLLHPNKRMCESIQHSSGNQNKTSPLSSLKDRLSINRRKITDPFLSTSSASSSPRAIVPLVSSAKSSGRLIRRSLGSLTVASPYTPSKHSGLVRLPSTTTNTTNPPTSSKPIQMLTAYDSDWSALPSHSTRVELLASFSSSFTVYLISSWLRAPLCCNKLKLYNSV